MALKAPKKPHYEGWKHSGEKDGREFLKRKALAAEKNSGGQQTNAVFSVQDDDFKAACKRAGIPTTTRQASKYRNKYGKAWRSRA
jgi:hypothetical protein